MERKNFAQIVENVENVENVDNLEPERREAEKGGFLPAEEKKQYPHILKKILFENLWILWIVIFEEDFRRFLPHPRRP